MTAVFDRFFIASSSGGGVAMDTHLADFSLETTQTLDELFHQILNQALVIVAAESGSLMLVDRGEGILQIKARLGKPRKERKSEVVFTLDTESNASWVARTGQSRLIYDTQHDAGAIFAHPRFGGSAIRSLLSVPIVYQGQVYAVINADAERPGAFTDWHVTQLERFAASVAPYVANRPSVFEAAVAIGLELAPVAGSGGVKAVLAKIAKVAVESLGADIVTLYEYDQAKDLFLVKDTGPTIEGTIFHPEAMRTEVQEQDIQWIMVHDRQRVPVGFYDDVRRGAQLQAPRVDARQNQRFVDREQVRSMAALLLPHRAASDPGEEIVGVLFANYRTPHSFNSDERKLLAAFADYAAIAIQNARHARQQRLRQQQVVSIISSFPASFAASMNNFAGTSKVTTQIIRERVLRDRIADRGDFITRQLDRIGREADDLQELAARLSEQFKATLGSAQLAVVDLPQVVRQACGTIEQDQSLSGDAIQIDLPPELPKVLSVEQLLLRLLLDILTNAVTATAGRDQRRIRIIGRAAAERNVVQVVISDNGRGIPPAVRQSLFKQPLTKQGSGGLSLWYGSLFMKSTGGDLDLAEPQPAEGAAFVLEIPCISEIDAVIVSSATGRQELLTDAILAVAPPGIPYDIERAASYEEAAQLLKRYSARLVILDYDLAPDWSGVSAVLNARRLYKRDARVIVVAEAQPSVAASEWFWCRFRSPEYFDLIRKFLR
jgi:GAF domain-containing protein